MFLKLTLFSSIAVTRSRLRGGSRDTWYRKSIGVPIESERRQPIHLPDTWILFCSSPLPPPPPKPSLLLHPLSSCAVATQNAGTRPCLLKVSFERMCGAINSDLIISRRVVPLQDGIRFRWVAPLFRPVRSLSTAPFATRTRFGLNFWEKNYWHLRHFIIVSVNQVNEENIK